jgi:hypothetical protein
MMAFCYWVFLPLYLKFQQRHKAAYKTVMQYRKRAFGETIPITNSE